MSEGSELRTVLEELWTLARDSGAPSLAKLIETESQSCFGHLAPSPQSSERAVLFALGVAATLKRGLDARTALFNAPREEVESRLERLEDPVSVRVGRALGNADQEILALKTRVGADIAAFRKDFAERLPASIAAAKGDDLKRHFSAFVDQAFRGWLASELQEVEAELTRIAERTVQSARETSGEQAMLSVLPELGARSLEIDSFQRDFGVFALSAVGVVAMFSNVFVGGALLALTPFLAKHGREKSEAELRAQVTGDAVRAVHEATGRLEHDLSRRLDVFAERLRALTQGGGERGRRGLHEMIESFLTERDTAKVPDPNAASGGEGREEGWQERLRGLVARLEAIELPPVEDGPEGR